jgi:hypothetical protein
MQIWSTCLFQGQPELQASRPSPSLGLSQYVILTVTENNSIRSAVCVSTAMGYGLDGQVSIPVRVIHSSLLYCVQTGPKAHPGSHSMSTDGGGDFLGG